MNRKHITKDLVRVIRASWDGRLDYFIDRKRANDLYKEGKLLWDLTNGAFMTDNGLHVTNPLHKTPGPRID